MKNINLEITLDEANAILEALGQQPYLKVADLIHKIQEQGANQMNGASQEKNVREEVKDILEHA